jgi:predicted nucleic acid-binding protein
MILVDSSVWIDHLRAGDAGLSKLLDASRVRMHSFVLGELACGNLRNREQILNLLGALPRITQATDDEVLFFIEQKALMGRGIGYIDAHLLAATALDGAARLWTRDRHLRALADELALGYVGVGPR